MMRVRVEIGTDVSEKEIVLRTNEYDEEVERMLSLLQKIQKMPQLIFYKDSTEYFFSADKILFFETSERQVYAHTKNDVFVVKHRLYELEGSEGKNMMRKKFWGVLLILAAIALVISRLGLKYSVPLGFWQVVGTLFFGAGLIEGLSKKKIGTSVFSIAFLLIIYQDQLNLRSVGSWTILGAALLITIGLNMIFKQRFQFWYENVSSGKNYIIYGDDGKEEESKEYEEFTENEVGSTIKVSSFLNTTSRYIQSQNLRRIDVKANLSDVNLYLDNAMLQDGHATIKVDVSLGDVNIYVPRSWEVNNSVDAFLADVKFVGMPSGEGTQNLKVEGSIRLGDVKVHYV